ncbi:M3 family oligoendopeptidase [Vineibacter terrae]|uniref:M3 family oligoendopeptidase n=1 Tax=Vineibacter terrae TaxID=2586908 RepID=A0A5C8PB62_9HYPH|nr:M3 family oligoendopeptidase [Vineibacter terrae]TXL71042.1 M3 family oligoendopeptidase [Vineibacter terrae]
MTIAYAPDGTAATKLGDLPTWDLGDLYGGMDAPQLQADLEAASAEAKDFAARYEGKLAGLTGDALAEAIAAYERMQERLGRVGSYAALLYAGDMSDPRIGQFQQNTQERITAITTTLLFFALEINRIEEKDIEAKLASAALARYRPWLRDTRAFRPHQLSDELEKLLHEKHLSGRSAWTRLFDETMARLRFPLDGRDLTSAEILHLLSDKDGRVREKAAKSFGKVMGDNIQVFALLTNTLAKDKEIEDKWRHFPRPPSARNLGNQVEDAVVDALVAAVKDAYPRLSHRYYKLKAKWFGVEVLDYWDRNAPLPDADDRTIAWPEATRTVIEAYKAFSPELAAVGSRFFANRWIDVPVRPGKAPGAFAHPVVPSVHPYLLLNYQGKVRDVMTLAHELGHGVHQILAGPQGYLQADTPLTLAETASVFGEMLTFQALLKSAPDARTRKAMLASKVEDMLNTVVRQIAFYDFEARLHDERRQGEITAARIGELWLAVQAESLGPALRFGPEYAHYWAYIPHFIHVPFYVYAYAFGDCLVNSLYAVYQAGAPGFQARYLDMLRAGGTLRHKELLAPFGLDASDPAFWSRGLEMLAGFIAELEEMG